MYQIDHLHRFICDILDCYVGLWWSNIPKMQIQELLDNGLLEKKDDPSISSEFKLTTEGSRFAEKQIIEKFGEFKRVTNHRGIAYKVPTIVIIREGIREQDLVNFPLWSDED